MLTREEFENLRLSEAEKLSDNEHIKASAVKLIEDASQYKWIHQTSWMGEPALQLPQDLSAIQEIIYKTRPTLIIEVGVCWGGTSLFCASAMKAFDIRGEIIGVDLYVPEDLLKRIGNKRTMYRLPPIEIWTGDSVSSEVIKALDNRAFQHDNVMVILDSYHTHEHVLNELRAYSKFLNKGDYLVCCDTIVEDLEQQDDRPWGKGNNPRTALNQFLSENNEFERDVEIENKLLLSCHPDGYIRKTS